MFLGGTITDAMQRARLLNWPLLLFVVEGDGLESCEALVRAAKLESVAIMQLVLVGTPEHAQFQALVKETQTPRVHVFAANDGRVGLAPLPPLALEGPNFTAAKLVEALHIAAEWSETYAINLVCGGEAMQKIEKAEREVARFGRSQEVERNRNALPVLPGGKPPAAEAAPRPVADGAAVAQPRTLGGSSSGQPRHAIQHYIDVSIHDKIHVVFQRPHVALSSVWDMALQHERRSDDESEATLKELVISSTDSDVKRHVASRAASEAITLISLTPKCKVTAVYAATQPLIPPSSTVPHEEEFDVVCDGDVCRKVKRVAETKSATAASAPVATSKDGGLLSVRCVLPDGTNVVLDTLLPNSTLGDVRNGVVIQLGHEDFAIYNSYPPRRFSDEELERSLKDLGISRNATLRVVMNSSFTSPASAAPSNPSNAVSGTQRSIGAVLGGLGRMFGVGSQSSSQPLPPPPQPQPSATSQQAQQRNVVNAPGASRPRVGTLDSLRARETEDSESADPNKRKSNRYYGGNSTEFEGQ